MSKTLRPVIAQQCISVPEQKILVPTAKFLFIANATDGPLILEIDANLSDQDHASAAHCAIGSGDIFPYFALAGLAHFDIRNRSLGEAKLIAYRVVSDAINVAAFGLGEPIQMIEIAKPPSAGQLSVIHQLAPEELRIIGDKVAEWKGIECEALSQFVGLGAPSDGLSCEATASPPSKN